MSKGMISDARLPAPTLPSEQTKDQRVEAVGRLLNAACFSATKHTKQRRRDPEETPYINHPIGVAHIMAMEGGVTDIAALEAALLHDTVEDTETTAEEIKSVFGDKVASIVAEVTDAPGLSRHEAKQAQIDKAPTMSDAAKQLKIADKIYNCRDASRTLPQGWDEERLAWYIQASGKVVDGCRGVNLLLERAFDRLQSRASQEAAQEPRS